MSTKVEQDHQNILSARPLFDQTLRVHIKRLIGTSYGIGGLPLDVVTLSCFVLLTEQAKNETDQFKTPSVRFTQASLIEELKEIGLPSTPDIEITIKEMVGKGYIGVDEKGNLYGEKPTLSMAQLLDHTFPKMPGMNLIAYLIQTLDEVNSGRKDPEFAIRQFDETLTLQGVQLKRKVPDKHSTVQDEGNKNDSENEAPLQQNNTHEGFIEKDPSLSEDLISPEKEKILNARKTYLSESKIISSDDQLNQVQIKKIYFGESLSEQNISGISSAESLNAPEAVKDLLAENSNISEDYPIEMENTESGLISASSTKEKQHQTEDLLEDPFPVNVTKSDGSATSGTSEPLVTEVFGKPVDQKKASEAGDHLMESFMGEMDFPLSGVETVLEKKPEEIIDLTSDDTVERHVIDFEEDLAMQCPLCKVKKVQIKTTLTGKPFYRCSNKNCHFISWGKPYHLACPRCQNPFLIEIINEDTVPILKCPRATCHYWKKWDGKESAEIEATLSASKPQVPQRRFVKRRVVRRKR